MAMATSTEGQGYSEEGPKHGLTFISPLGQDGLRHRNGKGVPAGTTATGV